MRAPNPLQASTLTSLSALRHSAYSLVSPVELSFDLSVILVELTASQSAPRR